MLISYSGQEPIGAYRATHLFSSRSSPREDEHLDAFLHAHSHRILGRFTYDSRSVPSVTGRYTSFIQAVHKHRPGPCRTC